MAEPRITFSPRRMSPVSTYRSYSAELAKNTTGRLIILATANLLVKLPYNIILVKLTCYYITALFVFYSGELFQLNFYYIVTVQLVYNILSVYQPQPNCEHIAHCERTFTAQFYISPHSSSLTRSSLTCTGLTPQLLSASFSYRSSSNIIQPAAPASFFIALLFNTL